MTIESNESQHTILVVEDESIVLLSLQMALEDFGYRVITATNGHDALQIFDQYKNEISLVVTDMSMPGMDGMALLVALRTKAPHLKVIVMSGHLLNTSVLSDYHHKPTRHITKPIGLADLITIVEDILAY